MKQRRKANKIRLVDLYCPKCKKASPHMIEKRETCTQETGIVGICIFCNNVRILSKTIRMEEVEKE